MAAETGRVFVAKTPEQFNYDADGNLLLDGRFNYSWDCENRLISVETRQGAVPGNVPRIKVEMKYDYLGRRVGKQVWEMRGQWSLLSSQTMVYNGWNLIREDTTASGTGKIVDEYVWGLDLSGSLQGAGGVGGLLCRQRRVERYYDGQGKLIICHHPPRNPDQPKTIRINENIWPLHEAHGDTLGACEGPDVTNSVFFYTYDGNGNVSELLQPATPSAWSSVVGPPSSVVSPPSSVVAHYEYSPFGELLISTGPEAQDNPFRFSTKYFVDELGIGDWGRRWYRPDLGRWLSRDPISDYAALQFALQKQDTKTITRLRDASLSPVYLFCRNNTLYYIDSDGRCVLALPALGEAIALTLAVIVAMSPELQQPIQQLVSAATSALQDLVNKIPCPTLCCRVGWHQANHDFPILGKRCHFQLTCWLDGVDNSTIYIRTPLTDDMCPPFGLNIDPPAVCWSPCKK